MINMLTSLSVDSITATGLIRAGSFITTETATLGSINADIIYLTTLMQSTGPVRVGSWIGGVWVDACKLEVNGTITCLGTLTAPNIYIYTKFDIYMACWPPQG